MYKSAKAGGVVHGHIGQHLAVQFDPLGGQHRDESAVGDAVLAAANLGDDADTTAAITGQVAGAFYGEAKIPQKWIDAVTMSREIGEMAEQLSQATEQ